MLPPDKNHSTRFVPKHKSDNYLHQGHPRHTRRPQQGPILPNVTFNIWKHGSNTKMAQTQQKCKNDQTQIHMQNLAISNACSLQTHLKTHTKHHRTESRQRTPEKTFVRHQGKEGNNLS